MRTKSRLLVDSSPAPSAAKPKKTLAKRAPRIDSRTKKFAMLTADVQRLTVHIARLQELRALLVERTMSRADCAMGSLAKTVTAYFTVFGRGYQPNVELAPGQIVQPESFVASIMDEDMLGGGFRGVETLLELWKRFNEVFSHMELTLTDITFVPLDEIEENENRAFAVATVTHSGYITLKTIEILFPHVLSNAALVMSILGRPVSGSGRTNFLYDCATGKVLSCMIDIDMFSTFAPVVESPADLDVMFKRAQISSEGFIGERDCIPADKAIAPAETNVVTSPKSTQDAMGMKNLLSSDEEPFSDDDVILTAAETHAIDITV